LGVVWISLHYVDENFKAELPERYDNDRRTDSTE